MFSIGRANDIYNRMWHKVEMRYERYCRERDREYRIIAAGIPMKTLVYKFYSHGAQERAYRQMTVIGTVAGFCGYGFAGMDWRLIAAVGSISSVLWAYNAVQSRFALALGRIRFVLDEHARENELRRAEMNRRNAARNSKLEVVH